MTKPAAAKAICRSTTRTRWRRWAASLSTALRASWLPKITNGWFFRAESFFSVARYLDKAALDDPFGPPPPDFLSHSHGEGFLRFFEERCQRQGIFIFDEPESALSPCAPDRVSEADAADGEYRPLPDHHGHAFADADGVSDATLLRLTKYGLEPVTVKDTDHYKVMREFCEDPKGFVDAAMEE